MTKEHKAYLFSLSDSDTVGFFKTYSLDTYEAFIFRTEKLANGAEKSVRVCRGPRDSCFADMDSERIYSMEDLIK